MTTDLEETARALVAEGKGILAADETIPTITKRLGAQTIESTRKAVEITARCSSPRPPSPSSSAASYCRTRRSTSSSSTGTPLAELLAEQGIMPGIKVDNGAKPLAGAPGERITEGLDGLRDRLAEYREIGARFAKWRAVITIGDGLPSARCVHANAHALARYAALCQEQGFVPIVEPEVLMDGAHTIERVKRSRVTCSTRSSMRSSNRTSLSKACC